MGEHVLHLSFHRAALLAAAVEGAVAECERGRRLFRKGTADRAQLERYLREYRELLAFLPHGP